MCSSSIGIDFELDHINWRNVWNDFDIVWDQSALQVIENEVCPNSQK